MQGFVHCVRVCRFWAVLEYCKSISFRLWDIKPLSCFSSLVMTLRRHEREKLLKSWLMSLNKKKCFIKVFFGTSWAYKVFGLCMVLEVSFTAWIPLSTTLETAKPVYTVSSYSRQAGNFTQVTSAYKGFVAWSLNVSYNIAPLRGIWSMSRCCLPVISKAL